MISSIDESAATFCSQCGQLKQAMSLVCSACGETFGPTSESLISPPVTSQQGELKLLSNTILTSMQLLVVPIILVGWASTIFGGGWLLLHGKWNVLCAGIGAVICSSIPINLALIPGLVFAPIAIWAQEEKRFGIFVASSLASVWYTFFVASLWLTGSFYFLSQLAKSDALIPSCLFAYSVATTPWVDRARGEMENEYTSISAFAFNVIAVLLAIGFAFFKFDFATGFWLCAGMLNVLGLITFRLSFLSAAARGESPKFPPQKCLSWLEAVWAFAPGVLVAFGGYIWAWLGVAASYGSYKIFQSSMPRIMKYLLSGAISLVTFTGYLAFTAFVYFLERSAH